MNKKTVSGLAIGATLVLLLAILYYFSTGNAPKIGSSPATAPGAPTATAPVKPEPLATAPTPPAPLMQPGAAPGIEPAGPPKEAASGPEVHVTVPPPLEPSQHYGILAGTFGKYRSAARMLDRLKKKGKPAFVQRDPRNLKRYQVWLGPFSSQKEAQEAETALRATLKKPLKIEAIENPVPK
jgi:cell division septation protein DedD